MHAAVGVKIILIAVCHKVALPDVGVIGVVALCHLVFRDGVAAVRIVVVDGHTVAHAGIGREKLHLFGDAPAAVIAVSRGQGAVAFRIQACLLGKAAAEKVSGNLGCIPIVSQPLEDLACRGIVLSFQQGLPLAVQGLLCKLGTVLILPEGRKRVVRVVPASVVQELCRAVVGGDLGVGLLGLGSQGSRVLIMAKLVEKHRGLGKFALVVKAACFAVDEVSPLYDLVRAEGNARYQHQRHQHQQNAPQQLSAGLTSGLVQRSLHSLKVETQILVLTQQVYT